MKHLNKETIDGAQQNLAALYQLFPSCFTEAPDISGGGTLKQVVNWGKLRELLGDNVADDEPEVYDFTWVGKRAAQREAMAPIRKTLRPCPDESVNWDTTQNLYIEGDNLEVLKLLQNSYMGKVKMIYIDPPYNTGNDFVYHDDFHRTQREEDEAAGVINEEGERMVKNTESNGKFHSDWCSMIYSRLLVARSLLTEDGVIFISIDDNEISNLREICDEVFGNSNFVSQIIVQTNPRGRTFDRYIAKTHEYILVYVKDIDLECVRQIPKDERSIIQYQREDEHGKYRLLELRNRNPVFNRTNRPKMFYPFYADPEKLDVSLSPDYRHSVEIYPRNSEGVDGCWTWGLEKATKEINLLVANHANTGKWSVFRKDYLEGTSLYTKSKALWLESEMNHENGKEMMGKLFGKTPFDFPKSVDYIKKCILLGTQKEDIILDFFSGSSTTAHAVMQLDSEDSGNRKFIMVQLPEECNEDSEAYKAGYKNICEIGKERIRRAGKKILEEQKAKQGDLFNGEQKPLDIGFRVFKCDESNYKNVAFAPKDYSQESLDLFVDNIKEDRTDLDLLFDCMLRWGITLDLPMTKTKVGGCTIHNVNEGGLVACFDGIITEKVIDAIAEMYPAKIVFRDSSFEEAAQKMNLFELFKQKCNWTEQEVKNNVRVI